jgi:hypothetical protein
MPLSDAGRAAMAYWGTIQSAVAQRATTADLWAAIRDAQANDPIGGGPVTLQGVNEVRSAAASVRNTAEAFGAARQVEASSGFGQSITSDMMTTVPWSREPQVLSTLADYQVRFEALFTTPLGQSASVVLTAKYGAGELPATVGDLVSALGAWAPASGSLPIGTFDGIGSVSITAV